MFSVATKLLFFVIFSLIAHIPAVAHGQEEPAAEPTPSSPIEVKQTIPDDRIASRIQELLTAAKLVRDVNVRVTNGVVDLEGFVESAESIDRVRGLVLRVDGVVETATDQLVVRGVVDFDESMKTVFRSLSNVWNDTLSRLPMMIAGVVALILTWIVATIGRKVVSRVLRGRKHIRSSLKDLAVQLTSIAIWLLGLMIAAVIVFPGMTPSRALTVLGLGSVAIGFAFKDIFENFFAGILILWRYPFDRGDVIRCQDIIGVVDEITIRNTILRRLDGQLVVLPNATLFKNPVDIVTSKQVRRLTIDCGVAYGEDIDEARDVIRSAVEQCKTVSGGGEVEIFAKNFGASSIDFEVTWWTGATPLEERQSRDEVIASVKRALDDAEIEIPFPHRTMTFREPLAVSGIIPSEATT